MRKSRIEQELVEQRAKNQVQARVIERQAENLVYLAERNAWQAQMLARLGKDNAVLKGSVANRVNAAEERTNFNSQLTAIWNDPKVGMFNRVSLRGRWLSLYNLLNKEIGNG